MHAVRAAQTKTIGTCLAAGASIFVSGGGVTACKKPPPIVGQFHGSADVTGTLWSSDGHVKSTSKKAYDLDVVVTKVDTTTKDKVTKKETTEEQTSVQLSGPPFGKPCVLVGDDVNGTNMVLPADHTCSVTLDNFTGDVKTSGTANVVGLDDLEVSFTDDNPQSDGGKLFFSLKFKGARKAK